MYGAEPEHMVSEGWPTYDSTSMSIHMSTMIPNVSAAMDDDDHFCKLILYKEIQNSRVRIWDILILVPNLLFLLFIVIRFNRARLKLRATSSPIYLAFYGLVICNVVISVIRCIVSMSVNAAGTVGGKADKVLWVTVRFFLLSTEMSVLIFGLAFGHLDSQSSIRRVLSATSFIALAFTITQGTLELVLPDDTFRIPSRDFYVFGHGGMMFWFCSSLVFTTIYLFILILPWTRLRDRLAVPTRKSFYVYAGTLAALDLVQSIGAGFLNYTQNPIGLCIVDFTAAVYLTLFTPLVYHTFLSDVFGVSQPSIMFSYKAQVDDAMDEDTVSLPHQQSFSSLKTDSDYIYQVHTPSIHMPLYDSQASKPSPSKQRASLYSLSSTKDSKSSSTNMYGSQATLYRSTSGLRNFARRLSTDKSSPDLANYPLTRSNTFAAAQKSSPDLRFVNPTWTSGPTSRAKYAGPSGASNFLSSNTASNMIYKPSSDETEFEQRKSLGNAINAFATLDRNANDSDKTSASVSNPTKPLHEMPGIPPLENTLRSILDSGTDNLASSKYFPAIASAKVSPVGSGGAKIKSDKSILSTTSESNALQKLLPRSASLGKEEYGQSVNSERQYLKKQESTGGLSDYLLSLTSPRLQKCSSKDIPQIDPSPNPSRSQDSPYTQTESLQAFGATQIGVSSCSQNHSVYDSTQFDTNATPVNPLYAASLQSPDSITGYSIDSQEAQNPANGYQQ